MTPARNEIYVRPFPGSTGGGDNWMVSQGGGSMARVRRDGELFYFAEQNLMAVEVTTSPVFQPGIPKVLFEAPIFGGGAATSATRIGGMSHLTASVSSGTPRSRRPPRFRSRRSQLDRRVEEMRLAAGTKLGPYEITVPIGPMLSCG